MTGAAEIAEAEKAQEATLTKKRRGPAPKDDSKNRIFTFRPDPKTWDVFNTLVLINKETMTDVFRRAVREYIREHGSKIKKVIDDIDNFNSEDSSRE